MLLPVRRPDLSFSRSNQPGFAGTSATTIPGPVAGRILNCDVKIAVFCRRIGPRMGLIHEIVRVNGCPSFVVFNEVVLECNADLRSHRWLK